MADAGSSGSGSLAKVGGALSAIDKHSTAAASGALNMTKRALGESNVALASALNARAEEAASKVHAYGKNYFRMCNLILDACAGFFAKFSCIVFFFSLLAFCLAAGLLAYTQQNSDPATGFGATHTAWRQAITITVLMGSLLSFHAIFMRHQTPMQTMGPLIWYCAIAMFVVASYDQEAVNAYCQIRIANGKQFNPCDTTVIDPVSGQPQYFNPLTAGNLAPAPALGYVCVFFWAVAGLILSKRGQLIADEIKEAELKAQVYQDLQAQAGAGRDFTSVEAVPAGGAAQQQEAQAH